MLTKSRWLQKPLTKLNHSVFKRTVPGAVRKQIDKITGVDMGMQLLLKLQYQELLRNNSKLPSFEDVQFRSFSQSGEDGILHFVFSIIGTTNRRVLEICAGDGIECNAANLIVNHGWQGLLFDGDENNIKKGQSFYARCPDTSAWPAILRQAWITAENINDLICQNKFDGELDLFSLDLDGNDYWIWDAINCISPRVVILEYDNSWDATSAVTQCYDPTFTWDKKDKKQTNHGASLAAFVKLGNAKGYRLVGCNRLNYNAIFIRNDIGLSSFPTVSVEQCLTHPMAQYRNELRHQNNFPNLKIDRWISV